VCQRLGVNLINQQMTTNDNCCGFRSIFCYSSTDDAGSEKQLSTAGLKDVSKLTARQQTILELLQTESNYVSIINTILKVCHSHFNSTTTVE